MREIVKFSMGVCSAYIACRLKETCHDPECLFSDTKAEDEDTYRFGREVVEKWGLNLIERSDGRHLWQVFEDQHMIPARQIPMCSIQMKIKQGEGYLKSITEPGRVAIGYDLDEEDRIAKMLSLWSHPTLKVWFPLIEWGVSKQQCFGFFAERGVQTPRIYRHFHHANCLPCKNFEFKDWIALKYHYPEKFQAAMEFEARSGLRWMQSGTSRSDVPDYDPQKRKRARKLAMAAPAFNFEMGCDACAVD